MSLRCIKILLLLFFITQSTAQFPYLRNGGSQNWPAQDFSQNFNNQPFGSNFPADSNIPFNNPLPINGNAPSNGQQTIPKLSFIKGQIGELLNIASNINNRQINNPSAFVENQINQNKLQMSNTGMLPNNLASNNPYLPVNSIYSSGNNLLNVPNNNFKNNLPVFNTAQFQYNLPDNSKVPFSNLPTNKPPKINSLTLSGQQFNNGLPFNVLPAVASNSVNNNPLNNIVNYNDVTNNGLKLPRSLPSNEQTENGYPVFNNIIENNGIASWQSYNNERQANMMSSNVPSNNVLSDGVSVNNGLPFNLPVNQLPSNGPMVFSSNVGYNVNDMPFNNGELSSNIAMNNINNVQPRNAIYNVPSNNILCDGVSVNNGLPFNLPVHNQVPSNDPAVFSSNVGIDVNGMPFNNGELSCNIAMNNINNVQPRNDFFTNNYQIPSNTDQLVSNNYQIPTNTEWQQPINIIQGYQNKEMSMTNQPASSLSLSQPTASNFNLPDFANINMLSLGEFGNFPIFSGLPVIGITETVSVINHKP